MFEIFRELDQLGFGVDEWAVKHMTVSEGPIDV
jgi:hypothetical protein